MKEIYIWYNPYTIIPPDNAVLPSIPIEFASCSKVWLTSLNNPQNVEDVLFFNQEVNYIENLSCNTIICGDLQGIKKIGKNVYCKNIGLLGSLREEITKINNLENVRCNTFNSHNDPSSVLKEKNISVRGYHRSNLKLLYKDYDKYIGENGIVYLSGYVNVKNKPDELSDAEWDHVLVLKEKVKEFVNVLFSKE